MCKKGPIEAVPALVACVVGGCIIIRPGPRTGIQTRDKPGEELVSTIILYSYCESIVEGIKKTQSRHCQPRSLVLCEDVSIFIITPGPQTSKQTGAKPGTDLLSTAVLYSYYGSTVGDRCCRRMYHH